MKRQALFAAAALSAALSHGFTPNRWQPVAGDWNGDYSDVAHWSLGHLPDMSAETGGEDAVFPNNGSNYTVTVDVSLGEGSVPKPQFVKIGSPLDTATSGCVSLAGPGTLRVNELLLVEVGRQGALGGDLSLASGSISLYTNSTLRVSGNFVYQTAGGGNLTFSDGATLDMAGGRIEANLYFYKFTSGRLAVSGGRLRVINQITNVPDGLAVEFSGGTVEADSLVRDSRFVPTGSGARLVCNATGTAAVQYSQSVALAGSFVCTNGTAAGLRFDASATAVGGEWTVGWLLPFSDAGDYLLGVSRLNIGGKYYPASDARVVYPADLTIGCWGGAFDTQNAADNRFYGTVTFDSTDALDGSTGRDFSFRGAVPVVGSSVRFTGSGSPSVEMGASESAYQRIRLLEVAAGAKAALSATAASGILQVGAFRLGAGSKLTVDPDNCSFVCLTAPEVDATATIELDLSKLTDSTDGTVINAGKVVRPVLFDCAGAGVDLSRFTLVNQPSGKNWSLRKSGACVYLQDLAAAVTDDSGKTSDFVWIGTPSDNDVSKSANWSCGAAPSAGSNLHFRFDGTNDVVVPSAGASVSQVTVAGYYVTGKAWRRCGPPYRFGGGRLTLGSAKGGYNAAVLNYARLPLVFENDVVFTAQTPMVYATAPVVFRGRADATHASSRMTIQGDVRVAGSLSARSLASSGPYTKLDFPYSSLTALDGGTVSVGAADSRFEAAIALNTMGGGEMAFSGAVSLTNETKEVEHLVDGRLSFGGAFSAASAQTFCGTGRVDFASARSLSEEPAPIVLAGGVTALVGDFGDVQWKVRAGGRATIRPKGAAVSQAAVTVEPMGELALGGDNDLALSGALALGASSRLVKDGAGRLTLASGSNSFAADSEVKVEGGTLAWTGEQSVGRLSVAPGATLEPGGLLSVAGDLSLDGVALRPTGCGSWTEVIAVPAGRSITGTPVARGLKCRVVERASGGQALVARRRLGLSLAIR